MSARGAVRSVTVFVGAYLVVSLPPFLLLNPEVLRELLALATLATLGTALLVVVAGLFLAREGVESYAAFLWRPGDLPSLVVVLVFVLAAASWWLVPELAGTLGRVVAVELVVALVLVAHLPMVLVLSLMTARGKALDR